MKILSISDLITNSSSEVFCIITPEAKSMVEDIFEVFNNIFGYNQEYEVTPVVSRNSDCVSIDLPYDLSQYAEFFRAGVEKIMDDYFTNFKIEYPN